MAGGFRLIAPTHVPPLEPAFRPAVLANRAFREEVAASGAGVPLVIALERLDGSLSRYDTVAFPDGHPRADANLVYAERLVKFLLWARGGWRVFIGGPESIGEHIRRVYAADGDRKFDYHFMGEQVHGRSFKVTPCAAQIVPAAREAGQHLGRHLDGCRIGFDLGASDLKVSAVVDGEAIFSEEIVWEPVEQTDPVLPPVEDPRGAEPRQIEDAAPGRHRRQLGRRDRRQPADGGVAVPGHSGRPLRRDPRDVPALPRRVRRPARCGQRRRRDGAGRRDEPRRQRRARHRDGIERGGGLRQSRGRDHRLAERAGVRAGGLQPRRGHRRMVRRRRRGRVVFLPAVRVPARAGRRHYAAHRRDQGRHAQARADGARSRARRAPGRSGRASASTSAMASPTTPTSTTSGTC